MIRLRYRTNCHKLDRFHDWWMCPRLDIQYCKRCGVLSEYRAEQVK